MKYYLTLSRHYFQKIVLFFIVFTMALAGFAQDKQVDVNVNVKKDNFWGQPWVWVVVGAIFILLLVAILRGSGSRRNV